MHRSKQLELALDAVLLLLLLLLLHICAAMPFVGVHPVVYLWLWCSGGESCVQGASCSGCAAVRRTQGDLMWCSVALCAATWLTWLQLLSGRLAFSQV